MEFPTSPGGLVGRRTRWAYVMAQTVKRPHFTGIRRHDLETGIAETYSDGPVWDANTRHSAVQVFVARVLLPQKDREPSR